MRKKYRIYRLVLRLYPRSFREHYGQEMVRVLDELLADETDALGRIAVWLRVSSELPFSIMQENIHKLGEGAMNKIVLKKYRRVIGISAGVAAVIVLGLSAGWLRGHVLPPVVGVFYRHGVQATLDAQEQAIGSPIETLTGSRQRSTYACSVYASQSIHTEVGCESVTQQYFKLESVGKESDILAKVATIENKLKEAGYRAGTNGVTLTSLVSGTYKGVDYSPDAFYQKVIGQYHCVFDTQIAYANPAAPAIHMHLSCTRTVNVLGVPSTATYQSSEGL